MTPRSLLGELIHMAGQGRWRTNEGSRGSPPPRGRRAGRGQGWGRFVCYKEKERSPALPHVDRALLMLADRC